MAKIDLFLTKFLNFLGQVKYFITWYRKSTLCKAFKNATNCVETETPKWTNDKTTKRQLHYSLERL